MNEIEELAKCPNCKHKYFRIESGKCLNCYATRFPKGYVEKKKMTELLEKFPEPLWRRRTSDKRYITNFRRQLDNWKKELEKLVNEPKGKS